MGENGGSTSKIIAVITLISAIFAILANIAEISEFVLNVFDRYNAESAQTSKPLDKDSSDEISKSLDEDVSDEILKSLDEDVSDEIQIDNPEKNVYSVDVNGKIIFLQETEIILKVKNNDEFIATDQQGYLRSKDSKVNPNNIYKIHNTPDGFSGLQGGYGFVRVAANEENAPIYENADEIQSWECYEFFKHNEYVCIKSQANEKYITCVLDEAGNRLYARGQEIQEWELFSVYIKSGSKWKNIFTDEEIEF